ncbi:MAG: peptidoglycan DD-metalloendopeptidase family protein [Oscillospiraceae bacterium]|nr:peptidoglycan DD-metalloendopeptidase family protein [Oscillospiraceae bacterium]
MSANKGAAEKKNISENTSLTEKNNKLESAMVEVGSLVTYLAVSAVRYSVYAARAAADKISGTAVPAVSKISGAFKRTVSGIARFGANTADFGRKFRERIVSKGFGKALMLQMSDVVTAAKGSKRLAQSFVNHAVPVLGIACLVFVVADKASADYGVAVECNGQEIGVVSEASVIDEAQKVIADRATYYDTGSEYITATLSIKPIGSQDEIFDEQMLADVIQEQIETQAPVKEEPAAESEDNEKSLEIYGMDTSADSGENYSENAAEFIQNENENGIDSNKVRAYAVTVDGEFIGAVAENSDIEKFLEEIKEQYDSEDIVSVDFDKDIEYTYEQYVDPEQIVAQEDIINILDSNVEEPVYYEIQQGDNPWNIARSNGMTVEELTECVATYDGERIDDITEYCPIGAIVQLSEEVPYLQVETTEEVTYSEAIDYEIVTDYDDDMYEGETEVDVAGVEGEKEVTALVTYRNGVAIKREIIDEKVISDPVTKYQRKGTRKTRTPVSTGSGGSGDYFWPVDGGYISAYQGDGRGHKGIDIAAPYGTPIYAAESGTVIEVGSGWNGGYGNCVRISHDDGNVTVYGHQSSIAIEYGDYVVKGQIIGYVGSTGDSTGNHLHFEVRSNGTYQNPTSYVSQY